MKKIILLCAAGMSTSILVNKMKESAKDEPIKYEINAYPISEALEQAADADVILLGPQVRFQEQKIRELLPEKLISTIDMKDYGTMNGKNVLEHAKRIMGDK